MDAKHRDIVKGGVRLMFKRRGKERTKKDKMHETEKVGIKGIGFFSSLNLYTRLLAEKVTGGRTDIPTDPLEDGKFYYSTNRIYTQKSVKKMYFLHDLPQEIHRGFVSDIRAEVARVVRGYNATHGLNERVSVNLIVDGENYDLDLSSKRTQGRWKYFTDEYERVQRKMGNRTLQDELKSDKYSDDVRHKVNSFLYIKEAKEVHDSSFFKTKVILEFIATSDDVLDEAERMLRSFNFRNRIQEKEVFIQTNEYQKAYTPMGVVRNNLLRKMHVGDVWTDDIISSFSVSTHGKVGDNTGIYHGVDVQSRNVLAIDMSKGSDAQNILLTAGTGEGKSNYAKMLYTFFMPLPDTYRTIVFDYKGNEYTRLGKLAGASVVSMAGGEGRYVNTMVIGDLTGDPEVDRNLKIEAIEATERVFHLLVDENHGMNRQELALFGDCLNEVYLHFGVTEDPSTWHYSKRCTFFNVYVKLLEMRKNTDVISEYGVDVINDFILTLKPYFEKGGIRTHWFREPISIQEIMDNKHLIFSFGMEGKDESMIDEKQLALRQMFASYLTMLLAGKNKANGLRTVLFLEELQRYLKQRYSGEIVAGIASGGRSLGMIVYYITNAPTELMLMAEGTNEHVEANASTIMSNITTTIIGALWKNDIDNLINQFGLQNSRTVLYQLASIKENNKKMDDLKYCFHVKYKGQSTIVRMLSHPDLEDLPLYTTLDDARVNTGEERDRQDRLRMNVGEEAIKKKIAEALHEEQRKQSQGASWDSRLSGTTQALWKDKV